MQLKAIVLLFLLVNTSFAFGTCNVLFVIDGSSYWPSFRSEMVSISTTGNLLYSSVDVNANANFWLYGDGDQDQPIPNWFYSTKPDFLDNLAEVQSNQGKETIVGATAKLNRWQINNAVIVLYTASPQKVISIAGYNYTEQYRTVAIHLNDGIDMSSISDYPSPQMSDFHKIAQLIADACRQLPTEGPSTSTPTTTTTTTTSIATTTTAKPTPTSGPACVMFFYLDGSDKGSANNGLVRQFIGIEGILGTHPFFDSATYAAAAYGQLPDAPLALKTTDRDGLNDDLQTILRGTSTSQTVQRAINEMNVNLNTSFVTILFTNSDQTDIDNAPANDHKPRTLGISIEGQVMGNIADYSFDLYSDPNFIASILISLCNGQRPTLPTTALPASTGSTTTKTTTTTANAGSTPVPLIPCQALFIADVSDAVTFSISLEDIVIKSSAQNLFNDPTLQFTASVWSYGDYSQIGGLPENFVNTSADFNALVDDLYQTGGTDDVKFVATKVNAWDKTDNVIVLFTASPQSVINDAGTIYQRLSATVGISLLSPAEDMSPLAAITKDFSDTAGIQKAIRQTCLNLLSATTATAGPTKAVTTGTELTSTTTPLPPVCPVFFYIDGSAAQNVIGQQIDLIKTVANSMFATHEWRFQSSVGAFGQFLIGEPEPNTLFDKFPDFLAYLSSLDFSFPFDEDVKSAIDEMNDYSAFGNVLTILFVAAPQATIDGANDNRYKDLTYGVGMLGNQDLTRLSYDSDDFTTDSAIVATLTQAINDRCTKLSNRRQHHQTAR